MSLVNVWSWMADCPRGEDPRLSRRLTIVMYHYVRDLKRTRYPRIKGLDLARFRGQLEYFGRHYNVIGAGELIRAIAQVEPLPPQALLLTFDDGYLDHFTNVFPLLAQRGWSGCFFPVASTITGCKVLDVNKIHFILASLEDPAPLAERIMSEVSAHRREPHLDEPQRYWERCSADSRYDSAPVTFVKRMLQRELPQNFRANLIDKLFREFVTTDESAFAAELYISADQLRCMIQHGMSVGSHGDGHYWMNTLSPQEQEREVDASLSFLASVGVPFRDWLMCYPYGGLNEGLLSLVAGRGAAVGFATTVGIADLSVNNPLALPRLDTNDLPADPEAPACNWTVQVEN